MSVLRGYLNIDVASAPTISQYFDGVRSRNLYGANYRCASSAPIFVRPLLEGGVRSLGEIPLDQDASIQISERHAGFEVRAQSAPSILEVRVISDE